MSLLEQDSTRMERINKFPALEFEPGNDKEYEVETIQESAVYSKEENGHLLGLYYLVAWKSYPEKENIWEPSSAVMHLRMMVSTFYNDHLKNLTAISAPLDSISPMAKPTILLLTKRKQGRSTECAKKRAKWGNKEEAIRRNPSQYGSRVRSRRVAGNPSL